MAACTPVRVDHLDLNSVRHVAPSAMVYNPDAGLTYIVYSDQADAGDSGSLFNHAVFFRTINPTTQALGTPVPIVSDVTPNANDEASMVRLSSGRLIVLIRTNPGGLGSICRAYESGDNGLTWSGSPATVFTITALAFPVGLATDGTNVWAWGWDTSSGKDMYFNKRTGVDTWGAEAVIYNGTSGSNLWEYYDINSELSGGCVLSSSIGFYAALHEYLPGNLYRMACLRTTNGGTFSEVTIKDYGATGPSQPITTNPMVRVASTGRVYVGWMEGTGGVPTYRLCVAYSDDSGATWTVIGTPTEVADNQNEARFGFNIDSSDRLYYTSQYTDNTFRIYRSPVLPNSVAGWELVHSCDYDPSSVAVTGGASMLVVSTDEAITVMHVFAGVGAGAKYGLYLLEDSFDVPGGGPGPSPPQPNPTGADENNIYVRKVLGPNSGGWSVHTFGVSCWMAWDEGDFDTGREVPILTAGSEVWPQIQAPILVGIINRIEAPELYAVRVYKFETGFTQTYDPLLTNIETKHFALDGPHNRNVVRAIYLAYRRSGSPFTAELWVDGKIVDTYEFADTQGQIVEKFRAVTRFGNVGSEAWLRIRDESLDPLVVDSIEFVFIKKGRRGNRG